MTFKTIVTAGFLAMSGCLSAQTIIPMKDLEIDPTQDGPSGDCLCLLSPRFAYQGAAPEIIDVNAQGEGPKQTEETIRRLTEKINQLPVFDALISDKADFDWLLTPEKARAGIYRSADGKGIVVANELVSRTFRIMPNLATIDFTNRMEGESMLRAVSNEGRSGLMGRNGKSAGIPAFFHTIYWVRWGETKRRLVGLPHQISVRQRASANGKACW